MLRGEGTDGRQERLRWERKRSSVDDDGDDVEVSLTREMLNEEAETSMSISRLAFAILLTTATGSIRLLSLIKIVGFRRCT